MAGASGQLPDAGDIVRELPDYRIEAQLGRGSMGVVYLAEDVRLQRKVALKVLAPTLADDELFRKRFNRESQRAANLDHPNIVPIYAAGEAAGLLYIAMRYVGGGDLRTLLDAGGPLSLERAAPVITQVAAALDAAHEKGLVHRDVKPANILIDGRKDQEHYYLSDFGITKNISTGKSLTSTGQFIGTIDYISPEQIQGKPLDGRADLYALGCVLYQCLTGTVPFQRGDTAALLWAHMQEAPPPVTARRPDLPPQIDRIVAKAMAKQPEDRYATCGQLAAALRAAAAGAPAPDDERGTVIHGNLVNAPEPRPEPSGMTSTYAPPRAPPAPAPVTTPRPRRRWPLVLGGLLGLVLVGVLAFAAVDFFVSSRFPTNAEEAVLERVPLAMRERCTRHDAAAEGLAGTIASVACTADEGANRAVFTQFASAEALSGAYGRAVSAAGVNRDSGDCIAAEPAESPYAGETGQPSGRVLCYQQRGSSHVIWTEAESLTLVSATRTDLDYAQLRDWWAGVVGRQVPAPPPPLEPAPPPPPVPAPPPAPAPAPVPPVDRAERDRDQGDRDQGDRGQGDRDQGDRGQGDRDQGGGDQGGGDQGGGDQGGGDQGGGDKPTELPDIPEIDIRVPGVDLRMPGSQESPEATSPSEPPPSPQSPDISDLFPSDEEP